MFRYVGDMLAWLHQICPGEAENITQLLKLCDKVRFAFSSLLFLFLEHS
jgi:Conserved oligomeric complex COG6